MNFMLQVTDDRQFCFDFVLATQTAINYLNWLELKDASDPLSEHSYILKSLNEVIEMGKDPLEREKYKDYVPVGSVEYVQEFICSIVFNSHAGYTMLLPVNVPTQLFSWSGEKASEINGKPIVRRVNLFDGFCLDKVDVSGMFRESGGRCFVKSNEVIKSELNGVYTLEDFNKLPSGDYQISTIIKGDIVAEYRCFVYQDKLIDVRRYSGDFRVMPNILEIEKIMSKYRWDNGEGPAPVAYTLDICIVEREDGTMVTEVIECHEFFSCGLYGFSDYSRLPFMLYRTFKEIIKNKNKLKL